MESIIENAVYSINLRCSRYIFDFENFFSLIRLSKIVFKDETVNGTIF